MQAPDQGQKHIPLRVPRVALGSEKCGRGFACCQCRPPFDKFVEGAKGETNCDRQEIKPFAGSQRGPPEQDFARQDGGNEALCEMSNPVVMVP